MKILLPKFKDCFCCGDENTKGLNVNYFFEDNKVYGKFTADNDYIISSNILHPGIALGVLFEAMSWVPSYILNHSMVLADFNVRVLAPPIIGKKLDIIAEAVSINKWLSEVHGVIKDEEDVICYKATGKFTYKAANDEHVENLFR